MPEKIDSILMYPMPVAKEETHGSSEQAIFIIKSPEEFSAPSTGFKISIENIGRIAFSTIYSLGKYTFEEDEENKLWQEVAKKRFLDAYGAEDAIYDQRRIRNKTKIQKACERMDNLRHRLAKKTKGWDATAEIRRWRDSMCSS